jgi:cytochrome b subunit of formate dehydrogenase
MDIAILSLCLGILGAIGTVALLGITGVVMWRYRNSPLRSFRRRWRNARLKQLSALACLFFLAMTASYGVLRDVWAFVYLIAAFKSATVYLRNLLRERSLLG